MYKKTLNKMIAEILRDPNISEYVGIIINNGKFIDTPKKEYITENELINTPTGKSKIEKCSIKKNDKTISNNKKYMSVVGDIWKTMSSKEIRNNTTFNWKSTNENGKRGYHWRDDIKMSIQKKDSMGTLKEIIKMVKVNKFTLELSIKLETGRIVNFKI